MSDPADELSPLQWCITAMNETTGRLTAARSAYPFQAITAVGEAVWRVTIVDATLLRHHPQAYDRVMASQSLPERTLVEGTLAGLRFVRNRMGLDADLADFVDTTANGTASGDRPATTWRWMSLPEPAMALLTPRGQTWERTRYEAYQMHLVGQTPADTFSRAAEFLNRTAAQAALFPEQHDTRQPGSLDSASRGSGT
jgi:hypothetical protein